MPMFGMLPRRQNGAVSRNAFYSAGDAAGDRQAIAQGQSFGVRSPERPGQMGSGQFVLNADQVNRTRQNMQQYGLPETRLPMRPEMAHVGPVDQSSLLYRSPSRFSTGNAFDPGAGTYGNRILGGGYYYAPDLRNSSLSAADQAEVNRIRSYGNAAGSGPYDSPAALGRFQSLQGTPPTRTGYGGMVTVQVGPPKGGLSPEMEQRRQAAIQRADTNQQMLQAGRNIRANQQFGAPLRPDLFPRAQGAYAPQSGAFGSFNDDSVLFNRYRTTNEDGSPGGIDYQGLAGGLYDRYRNDPAQAWQQFIRAGGSSEDIQAAIDAATPGFFGAGNPELAAWLQSVLQAGAGGQAQGAGPLTSAPPQTAAPPASPPIQFNPFNPVNSLLPERLPFNVIPNPMNPFNPFGRTPPAPPPPTPPRRRPGSAYTPNF
jgi:hypothetical protein